MNIYFLDTYALIELIKGNRDYARFINEQFRVTIFNLYELYYVLLKNEGENTAKEYYFKFLPFSIEVKDKPIFYASKFRLKNKKRDFSYVDALGYSIAKMENFNFLTGDREFEHFQNVEFVK